MTDRIDVPPSSQRARSARRWVMAGASLATAMTLAGLGASWASSVERLDTLPKGPVLDKAIARGTLIVGVRSYPRPAPAEAPTPPEPDGFDAALARGLASALGIQVQLVGVGPAPDEQDAALRDGRVDLLIAGVPEPHAAKGIDAAPGSYDTGSGQIVALRKGRVQDALALRGARVCVGIGSGYAGATARRYGAEPRSYPSSVHAVSAFMAGECEALAEDSQVLERLLQNDDWRFYKTLATDLRPPSDASVRLPAGDTVSRDYLAAALRRWRADGTLAQARSARAGNLQFEITLLKDGLVCHS